MLKFTILQTALEKDRLAHLGTGKESKTSSNLKAEERETTHVIDIIGAPDRNRTCNLLIRSQVLYPIELRAHGVEWQIYSWIELQEGPPLYRSFSFSVNSAVSIKYSRNCQAPQAEGLSASTLSNQKEGRSGDRDRFRMVGRDRSSNVLLNEV